MVGKKFRTSFATAIAKSLQSCPTLCDPRDGSPVGSSVPGILQARTLEWVAISFSNAWKWKVKVKSLSHVWPSATPWTAAFLARPSMGFCRQQYFLKHVQIPKIPICYEKTGHGSNLDVHQQMNGWESCGTYTQWSITQPLYSPQGC